MKTLFLVRHAKSSWEKSGLDDFDRPLNERGKRDAPRMGKWLSDQEEKADIMISSPAQRARKTAEKIADEMKFPKEAIIFEKKLYLADVHTWLEIVCGIPDQHNCAMLFGHNDGLTEFANYLTHARIANVPTSGVVKIGFETQTWQEISGGTGQLIYFQYPKGI